MNEINLVFMKCVDFQKYMNAQEIQFGQPYINESKSARLMTAAQRSDMVVYANPKLKGFRPEMQRFFLPKGLDQVVDFLASKNLTTLVSRSKLGYSFENKNYQDWQSLAKAMITQYLEMGEIK